MGQDYSYTQPSSSSDECDMTSLLEAEAQLYAEGDESRYQPVQYPPQPEADDRIPTVCYCGDEPIVATSYTAKDPGRRYFSCANVDDGDCHIWKWWDAGVTEEISEIQRQLRQLKEQVFEGDQKVVKLQKALCDLAKKKSVVKCVALEVGILVSALLCIGLTAMYLKGRGSKH